MSLFHPRDPRQSDWRLDSPRFVAHSAAALTSAVILLAVEALTREQARTVIATVLLANAFAGVVAYLCGPRGR